MPAATAASGGPTRRPRSRPTAASPGSAGRAGCSGPAGRARARGARSGRRPGPRRAPHRRRRRGERASGGARRSRSAVEETAPGAAPALRTSIPTWATGWPPVSGTRQRARRPARLEPSLGPWAGEARRPRRTCRSPAGRIGPALPGSASTGRARMARIERRRRQQRVPPGCSHGAATSAWSVNSIASGGVNVAVTARVASREADLERAAAGPRRRRRPRRSPGPSRAGRSGSGRRPSAPRDGSPASARPALTMRTVSVTASVIARPPSAVGRYRRSATGPRQSGPRLDAGEAVLDPEQAADVAGVAVGVPAAGVDDRQRRAGSRPSP